MPTYDFSLESLTIGDYILVLMFNLAPDANRLIALLEMANRCTNTDVMALPAGESQNVINQFMKAFGEEATYWFPSKPEGQDHAE